jgi:hypothetical protein
MQREPGSRAQLVAGALVGHPVNSSSDSCCGRGADPAPGLPQRVLGAAARRNRPFAFTHHSLLRPGNAKLPGLGAPDVARAVL